MTDDLFPLPEQTDPLAVARADYNRAADRHHAADSDETGELRAEMTRARKALFVLENAQYETARKSASAPEPA